MEKLESALRQSLGDDRVYTPEQFGKRATSYWDSSPYQARLLLQPRSTAEVSRALALCLEHRVEVVTQGGLTGCARGADSRADQVAISLQRMRTIEEIDPIACTVTVQAGAVLQEVQEAVAAQGLYFPLDLGARGSCTIGGNVATNAGGTNVIRHGMMRELVLGLEVVLADGTIIPAMNSMLKNNAGYDLKHLFIGSEGTLGVVTRAVLRLRPAPCSRDTAMVAVQGFGDICQLLSMAQSRLDARLSAFEVMWGDYYRTVTEPGWHRPPLDRDYPFYAIVESRGVDPGPDHSSFMNLLEELLGTGVIADAVIPKSESERESLWAVREDFDAVTARQPTYLYDVSLPIRHMAQYVERVQSAVRASWPGGTCLVFGHIGDGNLHLFVTPGAVGEGQHELSDRHVYTPLGDYGGSVSAEHGIGREKTPWLSVSRSPAEVELMRLLKRSLDPHNTLNPGVVLGDGFGA